MKKVCVFISFIFLSFAVWAQDTSTLNANRTELVAIRIFSERAIRSGEYIEPKLTYRYITPPDGVDNQTAKELIAQYLVDHGYKGNLRERLDIKEITVEQAWAVNQMQVYIVKLDYAWLHGVAVISDNHVVGVLPGMLTSSVYLADINHDQKYEVCATAESGSGIVDSRIYVLDIQDEKYYTLVARMLIDYALDINENGELVVYGQPWGNNQDQMAYLGRLFLKDSMLVTSN